MKNHLSGVKLRLLTVRDIPAGLDLCRIAGWNQREEDWRLLLSLGPGSCFAAEKGGGVVGTVTTAVFEKGVGWIAMVLVHPAMRRRGIGTLLFRRALEALEGCRCIKLYATPDGADLYAAQGFTAEEEYFRMIRSPGLPAPEDKGERVRPATTEDLPDIASLDAEAGGSARRELLKRLLASTPGYARTLRNKEGRLDAFCLGRGGENFEYLGPIAARYSEAAETLTGSFLQGCGGRAAGLVVPSAPEWKTRLEKLGFSEKGKLLLMYRGERVFGRRENLFGIAGPELG